MSDLRRASSRNRTVWDEGSVSQRVYARHAGRRLRPTARRPNPLLAMGL